MFPQLRPKCVHRWKQERTLSLRQHSNYNMNVAKKIGNEKPGKPMAKRIPGIDKGRIWIADDFNTLSPLELAEWHPASETAEARLEKPRPALTSNQVRKKLGRESRRG